MATSISRFSLDASQHKAIDLELKNIKILNRRLQESLNSLSNELQIFQRLIYKNKNQHRGALFWRNVVEVRRYSEKIHKKNMYQVMHDFRCSFYDSSTPTTLKGPWSYCPDNRRSKITLTTCKDALMLSTKACDITLLAYRAFHRSMQSGAFAQLLLTFIAVVSRIRMLCLELKEVHVFYVACLHRVLEIIYTNDDQHSPSHLDTYSKSSDSSLTSETPPCNLTETEPSPGGLIQQISSQRRDSSGSVAHQSDHKDLPRVSHTAQPASEKKERKKGNSSSQKKKKRTVPKNEIDDIFGF